MCEEKDTVRPWCPHCETNLVTKAGLIEVAWGGVVLVGFDTILRQGMLRREGTPDWGQVRSSEGIKRYPSGLTSFQISCPHCQARLFPDREVRCSSCDTPMVVVPALLSSRTTCWFGICTQVNCGCSGALLPMTTSDESDSGVWGSETSIPLHLMAAAS